jgi:hypothetical protein
VTVDPRGRMHRWSGRIRGRRAELSLEPSGPPIEQLAADLRRLLWRHDRMTRGSGAGSQLGWMQALEAAISARAMQAARALGVPYLDPPACGGLGTVELRRLLRALAAEGLVLPEEVGLLAPGGPRDRHCGGGTDSTGAGADRTEGA